MDDSITTQ